MEPGRGLWGRPAQGAKGGTIPARKPARGVMVRRPVAFRGKKEAGEKRGASGELPQLRTAAYSAKNRPEVALLCRAWQTASRAAKRDMLSFKGKPKKRGVLGGGRLSPRPPVFGLSPFLRERRRSGR